MFVKDLGAEAWPLLVHWDYPESIGVFKDVNTELPGIIGQSFAIRLSSHNAEGSRPKKTLLAHMSAKRGGGKTLFR